MSEEERTVTVILTIPRNHFEYLWSRSAAADKNLGKRHERVRREIVRDEINRIIKARCENEELSNV